MSRKFGPKELLDCYRRGVFPMGEASDDPRLFIVDPERRAVIPLDKFHVPRSLRKTVAGELFDVRIDTAFSKVVELCAESRPGRENTWINAPILNLYSGLHRMGAAHSVECWEAGELVGGLYGVSLGAAFFGESMFSRRTDASKVALVHLVARLRAGGYRLLDTQFVTPHLRQFGVEEISREEFQRRLEEALAHVGNFHPAEWEAKWPHGWASGAGALQEITQTS